MLLQDRDLSGHVIERRLLASPGAPSLDDGVSVWDGDFLDAAEIGDGVPALLWEPAFDDLSELNLVVPSNGSGVADWQAFAGTLRQPATFTTPDDMIPGFPIERPSRGTLAIGPALAQADASIAARLHIKATGAGGIVFRYQDAQNYYRFAIDRRRNRRVLSRFVNGSFKVLHVSGLVLAGSGNYDIRIDTFGSAHMVWVNGALIATVTDASHAAGSVGFYCQSAAQLQVTNVRVTRISRQLGDWRIDDAAPAGQFGIWRIAHGSLRKEAPAGPASGTSFAVIEDGDWADLRISVLCVPGATGEAGIAWRYASSKDHVRLALAPGAGTAAVIAAQAGTETILWSGSLPPPVLPGDPQWRVSAEAVGRRLRIRIDETLLAEIEDAGLGSGSVSAFASMADSAAFGPFDILHAAPAFEPWYVFGSETARVSGRRIRVAASAEPGGFSPAAGEEPRWKGLPIAGFARGLPLEGVDLRAVDAVGTVLHERRFQPPSHFTDVAIRIVRAADGTGLLVLPASGTLPAGEMRLDFLFRRDNTGVDAQSLILRQQGEQAPESITLLIA